MELYYEFKEEVPSKVLDSSSPVNIEDIFSVDYHLEKKGVFATIYGITTDSKINKISFLFIFKNDSISFTEEIEDNITLYHEDYNVVNSPFIDDFIVISPIYTDDDESEFKVYAKNQFEDYTCFCFGKKIFTYINHFLFEIENNFNINDFSKLYIVSKLRDDLRTVKIHGGYAAKILGGVFPDITWYKKSYDGKILVNFSNPHSKFSISLLIPTVITKDDYKKLKEKDHLTFTNSYDNFNYIANTYDCEFSEAIQYVIDGTTYNKILLFGINYYDHNTLDPQDAIYIEIDRDRYNKLLNKLKE